MDTKIFENLVVTCSTEQRTAFATRLTASVSKTITGAVVGIGKTELANFLREVADQISRSREDRWMPLPENPEY